MSYYILEPAKQIKIEDRVFNVDPNYHGLNDSASFRKSVAKVYYKKITRKWLRNDLKQLLALVTKHKDGTIHFIKSYSDYDTSKLNNITEKELEERIDHMKKKLITPKSVKHILKKIISKNPDIRWTTIHHYHDKLKKIFLKYFEEKVLDNLQK